jgi:hypothetical protein
LLKPAHVDNFTGYRHYTYEQLPRLNRILALKDLGFSLEEIGQLLTDDLLWRDEMLSDWASVLVGDTGSKLYLPIVNHHQSGQ